MLRLAAAIPFATVLAACAPKQPPKPPDQLEALLVQAREDSALARSVAAAYADLADPAGAIATDRELHADALQREIDRLNPPPPKSPKSTPPTTAPPAPQVPESSGAAKVALTNALRAAHDQAANLVPTVAPYRAGLLGSIAASCMSLREVVA